MNVLAFHGTGLSNYDSIIKTEKFSFDKRDDHWLGNGVYFFVDDFERAKRWAEGNRPDKDTEPVVIETEFEFEQGELLDLDKSDGLKKLDEFARDFITELKRKRVLISNIDEHTFHCKLLDAFVFRNKKYKAVCRTMKSTGNPIIGASRFVPLAKQLNIVDTNIINICELKLHSV